MISMIDAAGKHKVVQRTATTFEAGQDATTSALKELKLNWPTGLLLNDDGSRTNFVTGDKVADFDFDDVATAQLAIDREIKHRPVAYPMDVTEPEPDFPDLLEFQSPLGANYPSGIPRAPIFATGLLI